MRFGAFVAALALCACAISPNDVGGAGQAEVAADAPTVPGAGFPAGRVRGRMISETEEEVFGAQCRGAAAAVRGQWDGGARVSEGELFCSITGARRTRLRTALDLAVERGSEGSCRAAAAALQANWSGFWWQESETSVVCALTARGRSPEPATLYATNAEYCSYDGESEPDCLEFPFPLQAGPTGRALYDRPATTGRVVARIGPGETVNAVGYMSIRHFAHRGVVSRAGGDLKVGDVVFPASWHEEDVYPFADWDDPGDDTYQVMGNGLYEDVRFRDASAPLIEWEQLRAQEHIDGWLQLERADGTRGWAIDPPCALGPGAGGECADAATNEAEPRAAHPPLLYTLRADNIVEASFSEDGARINTISFERPWDYGEVGVERSWDATTGQLISDQTVDPAAHYERSVRVENGVAIVRASDGRILVSVRDDISRVNHALMVANGTQIATLSDNYTASLWDVATGQRVFAFGGRFDRLRGVIYSPDGARIITWGGEYPRGDEEEPTRIWDASNGRLLHALDVFAGVWAFSPDGRRFAMVEWDELLIYDAATGQVTTTIVVRSRHSSINSVVFSADGTRVLTGDPWNTASVWDVATGERILRLWPFDPSIPGVRRGPTSNVRRATFSPDGTRILTVGRGVAQVWDITDAASSER